MAEDNPDDEEALAALLAEDGEEEDAEEDEEEDDDDAEDAEEEAAEPPAALQDAEEEEEETKEKEEQNEPEDDMDAEMQAEWERDAAGEMDSELAELGLPADDEDEDNEAEPEDEEDDAEEFRSDGSEDGEDEVDGTKDIDGGTEGQGRDGVGALEDATVPAAARKRRGKPRDPKAPPKPLIPWRAFCSEARPKLLEDSPSLKSDLPALGKALAAAWAELPQARKDEMQALYLKEKAKYDAAMVEYRETDSYKTYQRELWDWSDAREVKKLQKRQKATQPKKPLTGYWVFAASVRDGIKRESPGLSLGDLGKKVSERWAALPAKDRLRYNAESVAARKKWEEDMKAFRHSDAYKTAVDELANLEIKQGLRRLKVDYGSVMPKRPLSILHLWSAEVQEKGTVAQISAKFKAVSEEERKRFAEAAEKLGKQFKDNMAAFLTSKEGQRYTRRAAMVKQKAWVRAARLKFLVDAPKRPPHAQVLFTQRKREELESGDNPPSGATYAARLAKMWESLPETERRPFEEEAGRLMEEFQKAMKVFKESNAYSELRAAEKDAVRRACGKAMAKAKGKAGGKAKAKGKARGRAKATSLVTKPESMPAKPPSPYQIYCKEQSVAATTGSRAAYSALSEDERKRLDSEAKKLQCQHANDMAKFMNSKDGKKYKRQLESAAHKQKVARARDKLLEGKPTKPKSAFHLFTTAVKGDGGGGKAAERWIKLSDEEKQRWEKEHEKQMAEYSKAMEEFYKSETFKKFERIVKSKAKAKGKAKERTSNLEGMPKRPPTGFGFFAKEMKMKGGDAAKAWSNLGAEGQHKFLEKAKAAMAAFHEDMKLWRKTAEGKKHTLAENRLQKRKTEQKAKDKYLKTPGAPEPPEKPKSAKMIFLDERRKQILSEEPAAAGGARELAARLVREWEGLTAQARKAYDNKAKSLLDVYEFEMEEYKSSEAYQKYSKALAGRGASKGKGRGRAREGAKRKGGNLSFDSSEMGSDSSDENSSD